MADHVLLGASVVAAAHGEMVAGAALFVALLGAFCWPGQGSGRGAGVGAGAGRGAVVGRAGGTWWSWRQERRTDGDGAVCGVAASAAIAAAGVGAATAIVLLAGSSTCPPLSST